MSNFTPKARSVYKAAFTIAAANGDSVLRLEHIFYALLTKGHGFATSTLERAGVDIMFLSDKVHKTIKHFSDEPPEDISAEESVEKIIDNATDQCKKLGQNYVGTEHLLIAMIDRGPNVVTEFLLAEGVVLNELFDLLSESLDMESQGHSDPKQKGKEKEKVTSNGSPTKRQGGTSIITVFCRDLVGEALRGEIGPVIGRDDLIDQTIKVLSRKTKSNPALIGEAGVGKTAILEGIAIRIAEGKVPFNLMHKRIMLLDLFALIGGTRYRGDFEEKMKQLLEELKDSEGGIILAIDEMHNMVGAGSNNEVGDAANILKPPLSRGEISCIGCTTSVEYNRYIRNDAALERRFQPIEVKEPNEEQVGIILNGVKKGYSKFHNVVVPNSLVTYIIEKSILIKNRKNPDKSIDLLDESCANAKFRSTKKNDTLSKLSREYHDTQSEIFICQKAGNSKRIRELEEHREKLYEQMKEKCKGYSKRVVLTKVDVDTVMSVVQKDVNKSKKLGF